MGACVTVDVKEIERLSKKLNSYSLSSSQETSLLKSLGVEIETQMSERLESTKTSPDGVRWADVSESTKTYLAKTFPGARPPLWREGGLLDSIESQIHGGVLLVGATNEYAGFHQKGTIKFPARPFAGLSGRDIGDLEDIVDDWLRRNFNDLS